MKTLKNLGILFLLLFVTTSCMKDNGVVPKDLKKMVVKDLKDKVFTTYNAQTNNISIDPKKGFFIEMQVLDKVVEFTRADGSKSRYGFEINNANRNSEELPEMYTIPMKSNYTNFYIYLRSDYSNASVTLTDRGITHTMNLKM